MSHTPDIARVLKSEAGSISLLVIGLFIVTVAILLVITDISAVAVANRSLIQATEAAAQKGVHNLDSESYYTGKGTALSSFSSNGDSSVPIDCSKAIGDVRDELNYWQRSSRDLKRREIRDIWITGLTCDGRNVWLSTSARAVLPLQLPFVNISEISISAYAAAGNQRSSGTFLFGIRIL